MTKPDSENPASRRTRRVAAWTAALCLDGTPGAERQGEALADYTNAQASPISPRTWPSSPAIAGESLSPTRSSGRSTTNGPSTR